MNLTFSKEVSLLGAESPNEVSVRLKTIKRGKEKAKHFFSPLLYAFERIDDDPHSTEEEPMFTQLKHRVFEDGEVVEQKLYARSNKYKQVVDASDLETLKLINKREEFLSESDCVPVTWHNVFHHSIFGKPKFCHVP